MTTAPANPYLRTTILTASPGELRLMLLDGAIRFAEQARKGLVDKHFEHVFEGTTRCQNILLELISNLRPEHDPELCKRLSGLYTFLYTRLMNASTDRDPAVAEEVIRLLQFERETWAMLLEKVAQENAAAASMTHTPATEPRAPAAHTDAAELVGGTVCVRG